MNPAESITRMDWKRRRTMDTADMTLIHYPPFDDAQANGRGRETVRHRKIGTSSPGEPSALDTGERSLPTLGDHGNHAFGHD